MTGGIDATPTELLRLLVGQVPSVALVEYTIRKCAARSHRKEITLEACAVRVNIEDSGSLDVMPAD